ncbi:hypothetical protein [uncultured Tateyamaria sp.]|uniref:hypothetical protein n=1 Tax=uncultured Tateyamaria sp. TaxID=455651 RepID=UPI00261238B4|nr:hypothetical protein [uncultured Tateyamaria sp.]
MALKVTKTPFLIAAIATTVALMGAGPSRATVTDPGLHLISEPTEVVEAKFKVKKRSVHKHRGFKHRSLKRHRSFHHRSFRHSHRLKYRGYRHHPKTRSRIIIKKRF